MTDDDINYIIDNEWECDLEPADLIRSRRDLAVEVRRLRTELTVEQLASSGARIDLEDLISATRQLLDVTRCQEQHGGPITRCGECPWCTVYTLTREDDL